MRVTVVGAGVVGLAVATELAERGADVRLLERNAELGGNASWLAGGMLAPFCEGESAPASVVERGQSAIDWWDAHVAGVARQGSLVLAPPRDSAELDRFAARTRGWERLDEAGIAALEPDLATRFRKGLFYANEGHVDPRRAMTALRDGLVRKGVNVRFGVSPLPLAGEGGKRSEPGESRASRGGPPHPPFGDLLPRRAGEGVVIDCRGYAARDALPDLRGVRGEMLLVRTHEVRLSRPIRLLHPRIPLYVVPRADGIFMVGATMIESGDKGRMSVRSAIELLSAAFTLHPAFGEAEILEMSADVRPSYPDNAPRIVERCGRIFVNGVYRHGYLLAPDLARRVAQRVFAQGNEAKPPLGRWLAKNPPRVGEIARPPRREDRPAPFVDRADDEVVEAP